MGITRGERFLVFHEDGTIKLIPILRLSKLAGVDEELFKGRKLSEEIEAARREWDREFEKRVQRA